MPSTETKDPLAVTFLESVCTALKPDSLPLADVREIVQATRLKLIRPADQLAMHLGAIKLLLARKKSARDRKTESSERQNSIDEFEKRIASIRKLISVLSHPRSPLAEALMIGATTLGVEEAEPPPVANLKAGDPPNAQVLIELGAFYEYLDRWSSSKIALAVQGIKFLEESARRYHEPTGRLTSLRRPAFYHRVYAGEILPSLFTFYFGREFKISKNPTNHAPGGPGVRFLRCASQAVGISNPKGRAYSDEGLIHYWKQVKREPRHLQDFWTEILNTGF